MIIDLVAFWSVGRQHSVVGAGAKPFLCWLESKTERENRRIEVLGFSVF